MPVDLWTSPAFVAEARAWVVQSLADDAPRERLTGEWEQPHARPWSSAIRFETSAGRLWFKVSGPGTRHEPHLTWVLAGLVPGLVPEVLAVDAARGWSLQRDAGPTMRDTWPADQVWERWERLLTRYAEAQRVVAAHQQEVLAVGLPRQDPSVLPDQLADLTTRLARTPVDAGGLTAAEAGQLDSLLPVYAGWCAELQASGIASSVDHGDLHSANVCVPPGADVDAARIIDWGDSVWSHPFSVLLTTLGSAAFHAGTEVTDPRVRRLRDAYLATYADHGSAAERHRWSWLARRTGCVTKALSYVQAFEGEPPGAEAAEDWPVRAWLREMLDPVFAG